VLIGGRPRPDRRHGHDGPDHWSTAATTPSEARGDEVVLIGRQGDASITADDWAARLGTIAYEIVCGISPRLPRTYTGG
jgi:alanine racemase